MNSNIFTANPIDGGYSWTITSRLGEIIKSAELLYGERNKRFNILGIETTTGNQPQIWFPGDCGNVIIQITEECFNNMPKAIFQVAHEVIIHCLCPKSFGEATYLEEGLAAHFAIMYTMQNCECNFNNSGKYELATRLIKELLVQDSDLIKKIRLIEPDLSQIDEEIILNIAPNTDKTEQVVKSSLVFLDADGNNLPIESFRGKYLVLYFWNSGCGGCIRKFPQVQELFEDIEKKANVELYSVFCYLSSGKEGVKTGGEILRKI